MLFMLTDKGLSVVIFKQTNEYFFKGPVLILVG